MHFVREMIVSKLLEVRYVSMYVQVVDALTKGLMVIMVFEAILISSRLAIIFVIQGQSNNEVSIGETQACIAFGEVPMQQ
ncbi:hypothetical protein VitviT2T_000743 [Vitis vinifera]|uniref:Uncharacterized protein n=1 Tax=Vitis vinifera TaxID=29760 RepID=A0ABY9BDF5_VITVI|nr:hypothetical protein VitviT2T_000743 [Vitis vinifera]